MKQLQTPLISVLQQTLVSHRYALSLDPGNADTLFNIGQVLTSIAEEISNDDSASGPDAVAYLEEALEFFQRCLVLQELRYTQSQEMAAESLRASREASEEDASMQEIVDMQDSPDAGSEKEQWASIIEPVTKDTLIDTIIAQLSTSTTLCSILGSSQEAFGSPNLAWIEEYSSKLLNAHLPTLLEGTERSTEVAVAKAVFISAMLEAGFRREQIDLQTYRRERDAAFAELPISTSFAAIMANVMSLFAFNQALSDTYAIATETTNLPALRWNALAKAISNLTTASEILDIASEDFPKIHSFRGDASLSQYQLSKPPNSYGPALKNSAALLKNAEVFYRNTSRLTSDEDERNKSKLQEAIVMLLQGNMQMGRTHIETMAAKRGEKWLRDQVKEMLDEGSLGEDDVAKIALSQ